MEEKNFEKIQIGKRYLTKNKELVFVFAKNPHIQTEIEDYSVIFVGGFLILEYDINGKCISKIKNQGENDLLFCLD